MWLRWVSCALLLSGCGPRSTACEGDACRDEVCRDESVNAPAAVWDELVDDSIQCIKAWPCSSASSAVRAAGPYGCFGGTWTYFGQDDEPIGWRTWSDEVGYCTRGDYEGTNEVWFGDVVDACEPVAEDVRVTVGCIGPRIPVPSAQTCDAEPIEQVDESVIGSEAHGCYLTSECTTSQGRRLTLRYDQGSCEGTWMRAFDADGVLVSAARSDSVACNTDDYTQWYGEVLSECLELPRVPSDRCGIE